MKKKFFAVMLTAAMVVASAVTALAADTASDLIGHFKFDESLKNEVGGDDAVPVKKGAGAHIGDTDAEAKFSYVDGVDGKAIYMNENGLTTGLDLKIKPKSGKAYTISVWVKAIGCNFANPIVWAGKKNQSGGECWTGIWPGFFDNYLSGPQLGSNDANGVRTGAVPASSGAGTKEENNATFDWLNITVTISNGAGKLYYNGILVAQTGEGKLLPDIIEDGDDTVSIYLGANAWNEPVNGYVDELYVFDRALTTEDVRQLVSESKTNASITLKTFDEIEERTTDEPTTGSNPDPSAEEKEEEKGSSIDPAVIGVIVVIAVIVIIVGAAVVIKSKKKGRD